MNKLSQHARILKELKAAGAKGVPNYRFPQMGILSYTKRISELRLDGDHTILKERQYSNGRATGVWLYFLADEPIDPYPSKKKFLGLI